MNKPMTQADIDKAIEEIDEIVSKKLLELEQTENNLRAAVLAEREACIEIVTKNASLETAWKCEEEIRARGNT
jgi:hypothetical protein